MMSGPEQPASGPSLTGNPLPQVNDRNGFPRSVPLPVLRVVARAIRHAWSVICSDPKTHLLQPGAKAPEEDVYTEALCQLLNQMLAAEPSPVPGFSSDIIDTVCRCENLVNFSGQEINKSPDLVVRLANESLVATRRWVGVFVESKMVSMKHSMDRYATDGLGRFVRGEYAWAMRDGLMLAYQKPKHRSVESLINRLDSDDLLQTQADNGAYFVRHDAFNPLSGRSTHARSWTYVGGGAPGTIQVWHLWDLATPLGLEAGGDAPSVDVSQAT